MQVEYLRTADVTRIFGIKRGTLYGMAKLGLVSSRLIKVKGVKSGVRLWSAASIRACIERGIDDTASVRL